MGLFSWFSKKDAPEPVAVARIEPVPAPAEVARAPAAAAERSDSPFGGAVSAGLARYLNATAQSMRTPGDKQYVSNLLRAVKNDGVEVPAMPSDVMEIQRLLSSPDSEIADLAKAVQRDPATAAKFISVANSPLYRGVRSVSSVREALVRIGLNHSGMILLAIVSSSKLFRVPGYEEEAKWLHAHALSVAVLAQYFARMVGENEQDAFMAGLLHDLGRVFMLAQAHEVYRASHGQMDPDPATVLRLCDELHTGFSALVAEVWDFQDGIVSALQHHHTAEKGGAEVLAIVPPAHEGLTRVVCAANLVSSADGDTLDQAHKALPEVLRALGLEADDGIMLSARETARTFLADLGVRDVPRPF